MSSKPPKQKGKGTRKRNGKAAGTNEEGGDGSQRTNASWSDSLVKTLLLVCRDFQKNSEGEQQFKWPDITSAFQKASGMPYNQDSVKNKFDQQKRIWQDWNDLRYKETGCGWDYRTGRVTAPDEWWTKKLKESDKYKRFRKAGVDPATSELWDQVFGFTTDAAQLIKKSQDISLKKRTIRCSPTRYRIILPTMMKLPLHNQPLIKMYICHYTNQLPKIH